MRTRVEVDLHQWICLAVVLLIATLAASSAEAQIKRGSRFEQGTTCTGCHAEVGKNLAAPHAPLAQGECTACHRPHGLVGALRLQVEEPELCLGCHEAQALGLEAAHQHPEVGRCSTCHNPHGSDHPAMLANIERELCTGCHTGSDFESSMLHAPVADDCLTCHRAHGADEPALLDQPREALCGSCHDDTDGFAAGHGGFSVAGVDCKSCHPPHSAASEKLLRASVHPELACD
ncbi:MAG: cytochrome c3 family protein, partial [Thermoanaerobaculia bacterium]